MENSLKDKLNEINKDVPKSVNGDLGSLLYGVLFAVLGYWLLDMGSETFGIILLILGILGVITGLGTFISKSPKMKILQAIDNFLLAIVLLGFAAADSGEGIFENPLVTFAIAGFAIWSGWDDLKEYRILTKD